MVALLSVVVGKEAIVMELAEVITTSIPCNKTRVQMKETGTLATPLFMAQIISILSA